MSASLELKSATAVDTSASSNWRSRLHFWTLPAVCLLYIVQLWTPLRLTGDSIELLSMASSAADGHGFLDNGRTTHYPPGYPAMVVCLERVGAARPWGLVGLNALFLFIGFASSNYVVRRYFQLSSHWAVMTLLFTALSFALIKHFTLPLTDVPFFGISMVAVALIVRAETEPGALYYIFLTLAFLTSAAAALVRPIAIALLPSLAWSLGAHFRLGEILRAKQWRILIVCCALAAVVASVSVMLLHTKYVQEALSVLAQQGLARGIRNILLYRLHEIGELFLNAPAGKLGSASILVWLFGAIATAVLLTCVRHCRLGVAEIYLASYVFIMLPWPYADTRFWMPVLPLIFAELFSSLRPWTLTGWRKQASLLYSAAYMLMGLAALAYSTRITFSGREFPRRYGDENIRSTYEVFYSDPKADRSRSNASALELLQRYSRTGRH
jgi:hypothetical protein